MARRKRDEQYVKIANELLANNEINNAGDLQAVLKEVVGSAIETMLEGELTEHLDYERHQASNGSNKRNGTTSKEIDKLIRLKVIKNVTASTITYTSEFKVKIANCNNLAEARELMIANNVPIDVIGERRFENSYYRLRNQRRKMTKCCLIRLT